MLRSWFFPRCSCPSSQKCTPLHSTQCVCMACFCFPLNVSGALRTNGIPKYWLLRFNTPVEFIFCFFTLYKWLSSGFGIQINTNILRNARNAFPYGNATLSRNYLLWTFKTCPKVNSIHWESYFSAIFTQSSLCYLPVSQFQEITGIAVLEFFEDLQGKYDWFWFFPLPT